MTDSAAARQESGWLPAATALAALNRSIAKALEPSATAMDALNRSIAKALEPSATAMDALNRSIARTLTGSLAEVGTLMARAVAGVRLADPEALQELLLRVDYWRQQEATTPNEARAELARESPAFEWITRALPKNRAEWYAFVAVLLALGQFALAVHPPGSGPAPPPRQEGPTININIPAVSPAKPAQRNSPRATRRGADPPAG